MNMYKILKLWMSTILLAVFLGACASSQNTELEDDGISGIDDGSATTIIDDGSSGADASGIDGSDDGTAIAIEDDEPKTAREMLEESSGALGSRTIYFQYDSAKLSDESLAILEEHGNFVAANGEVSVRLEGHADERGSREYNIALGDRRAQSVRRVLLFQGAAVEQVDTVSYGEEKPAVEGQDESAWSKNRRVELIYTVN